MAGDGSAAVPLLLLLLAASAEAGPEADALLKFREGLRGSRGVPPEPLDQWLALRDVGPCLGPNALWYGVTCHPIKGEVLGVRLEYLGLQGHVPDLTPLRWLPGLRVVSLANNNLTARLPATLAGFPALKMIFLQRNALSEAIPDGTFAKMSGLRKLDLSYNDFSGPVPTSVAASQKLLVLKLSNNRFEGALPDFRQKHLQLVDVSENNLSGRIPDGLQKFNASSFQGNKDLCGPPLDTACPVSLLLSPESSALSGNLKVLIIIALVVVVIGGLLGCAGIVAAVLARRKENRRHQLPTETLGATASKSRATPELSIKIEQADAEQHGVAKAVVPAAAKRGGRRDDGRLIFVQEGREEFELEDLLRASAEVLGAGNFGASYKATMLDGVTAMVVKRFKDMNAFGREDFREHMFRLGRVDHPNLLPLVAYRYKKEEKLFVTEYVVNGSLAHLLHGGTRSATPALDWPKRLNIIKGVARGLAYLYEYLPMLNVPHGHLKSSNVLLDASFQPLLGDYSLLPLLSSHHAGQVMVAYKSPECAKGGKPSKKSDVWSLGILILEVLTGKFPANYLRAGQQDSDLAGWVHSVVREEWTGEVFDKDMKGTRDCEGEMVKLLKVGLACCEADVASRWDIAVALARIEEVRERNSDDGSTTASSFASDAAASPPRPGGDQQPHST